MIDPKDVPEVPYVWLDYMDGQYFIHSDILSHLDYVNLPDEHKHLYVNLPRSVVLSYLEHLRANAVFQHMFLLLDRAQEKNRG